jgi:hypothetical protein
MKEGRVDWSGFRRKKFSKNDPNSQGRNSQTVTKNK